MEAVTVEEIPRLTHRPNKPYKEPEVDLANLSLNETSLPIPEKTQQTVKAGYNLIDDDVALSQYSERKWIIEALSDEYKINFSDESVCQSKSASYTSPKGIISDDCGNLYFLKEKPAYCSTPERLHSAAMVQSYLSKHVNFVVPIIQTADGSPYALISNRHYLVTPYIEGRYFNGSVSDSIEAVRAVAYCNNALSKFSLEYNEILDPSKEVRSFVEGFCACSFPDQKLLKEVSSSILRFVDQLDIEKLNGLPLGWIHSDPGPFNYVFRKNQVVALNDFDNAAYGPVVRDLAISLITNCTIYYLANTSSFNSPISRFIDEQRMQKMLDQYIGIRQIGSQELAALPTVASLHWLELISLGLWRGDFSLSEVKNVVPHTYNILDSFEKVISRNN